MTAGDRDSESRSGVLAVKGTTEIVEVDYILQIFSACRHNRRVTEVRWRGRGLMCLTSMGIGCRIDDVQAAIDGGLSVDTIDENGNTLLHIACQNGLKQLCRMLVRKDADLDAQNSKGNTPL
jgi:hypothetical protein